MILIWTEGGTPFAVNRELPLDAQGRPASSRLPRRQATGWPPACLSIFGWNLLGLPGGFSKNPPLEPGGFRL
jgi:hypothetical protein